MKNSTRDFSEGWKQDVPSRSLSAAEAKAILENAYVGSWEDDPKQPDVTLPKARKLQDGDAHAAVTRTALWKLVKEGEFLQLAFDEALQKPGRNGRVYPPEILDHMFDCPKLFTESGLGPRGDIEFVFDVEKMRQLSLGINPVAGRAIAH